MDNFDIPLVNVFIKADLIMGVNSFFNRNDLIKDIFKNFLGVINDYSDNIFNFIVYPI